MKKEDVYVDMTQKEIDDVIKKLYENEDSAVKVLNKCTELFKENERLKQSKQDASEYIRKYAYSIKESKSKEKIVKIEFKEEEFDELMKILDA